MPPLPYISNKKVNPKASFGQGQVQQFDVIQNVAEGINKEVQEVSKARLAFQEKMEKLKIKDQVDSASINADKETMLLNEEFESNPENFKEGEYEERIGKINESNAGSIESTIGQDIYSRGRILSTEKNSIKARFTRQVKTLENNRKNASEKIGLATNNIDRQKVYDDEINTAKELGYHSDEWEEVISFNAGKEWALYDAEQGVDAAQAVLDRLGNSKDKTYPLTPEEKITVGNKVAASLRLQEGESKRAEETAIFSKLIENELTPADIAKSSIKNKLVWYNAVKVNDRAFVAKQDKKIEKASKEEKQRIELVKKGYELEIVSNLGGFTEEEMLEKYLKTTKNPEGMEADELLPWLKENERVKNDPSDYRKMPGFSLGIADLKNFKQNGGFAGGPDNEDLKIDNENTLLHMQAEIEYNRLISKDGSPTESLQQVKQPYMDKQAKGMFDGFWDGLFSFEPTMGKAIEGIIKKEQGVLNIGDELMGQKIVNRNIENGVVTQYMLADGKIVDAK